VAGASRACSSSHRSPSHRAAGNRNTHFHFAFRPPPLRPLPTAHLQPAHLPAHTLRQSPEDWTLCRRPSHDQPVFCQMKMAPCAAPQFSPTPFHLHVSLRPSRLPGA
jgi:hypothetical protein